MNATRFAKEFAAPYVDRRYWSTRPQQIRELTVHSSPILPTDPRSAGEDFVDLCLKTCRDDPLPARLERYLPWFDVLRDEIWQQKDIVALEVERAVGGLPRTLSGSADLVGIGNEEFVVVEVKLTTGTVSSPNPQHMAQLAAYCHALAAEEPGARIVPILAYVELSSPRVSWFEFENGDVVVGPVRDLIERAAA